MGRQKVGWQLLHLFEREDRKKLGKKTGGKNERKRIQCSSAESGDLILADQDPDFSVKNID